MKIVDKFIIIFTLIIVTSCHEKYPTLSIQGKITETNQDTIYLLKRNLQAITTIDSVIIDKDGNFKFKTKSQKNPEFYILKLKNQFVNIAADSTETITVNASANNFALNYTIDGSPASENIKKIISAQKVASNKISILDQKLYAKQISEEEYQEYATQANNEYKTLAKKIILEDLKSPAAYFALFQKDNKYLFFNPYDKDDYKMFAAVANIWNTYYPESERSIQMKAFTLEALKIRKNEDAILNKEIRIDTLSAENYFNIDLPGLDNKKIALSNMKGKYTILDFTAYNETDSPAHNILLNKAFDEFKNDLNIYQVSFDTDIHFWRNAASNLPWVTVYSDTYNSYSVIKKFNIQTLPTTFLLDKQGSIVKRINVDNNIVKNIREEI